MIFTASLLFKSSHTSEVGFVRLDDEENVWEEIVLLVYASDEEEAKRKAIAYGKSRESSYNNEYGELVSWKFVQIERVCLVEDESLNDGTELFSRFLKESEVESMLKPFD